MPRQPTVSIIIPLHNSAFSIEQCLDAIQAQSYQGEIEILVVDNNSKDDGPALAAKKGVNVLRETMQGAGCARNCGIKAAKGEYLAFLDADVILDPNWIKSCVRAIEPAWIDCVQSAIIPHGSDEDAFMLRFRKRFISHKTKGTFNYLNLISESFPVVNSAAFMIKTNYLRQKNLEFSTDLLRCEDSDFTNRLMFSGCHFAVVSDAKANVLDDRNPVQYLTRSFKIGRATAKVRRRWGGSRLNLNHYFNQFAKTAMPKSQEDAFLILNQVSSFVGDFIGAANLEIVREPHGQVAREFFREDRRNPYFLRIRNKKQGDYELSKKARIVWLEGGATILDLAAVQRCHVNESEAKLLSMMMHTCVSSSSNYKVSEEPEVNLINKMINANALVPSDISA
jgi:glycosyltransferase involved in cell wall biosynthesis